jgi:hypothetical protein
MEHAMSFEAFPCGHGRTTANTQKVGSPGKKQAICRLCQRVRVKLRRDEARLRKPSKLTLGKKIALGLIK